MFELYVNGILEAIQNANYSNFVEIKHFFQTPCMFAEYKNKASSYKKKWNKQKIAFFIV